MSNPSKPDLEKYKRIFTRNYRPEQGSLDRGSLPSPLQYLSDQGLLKGKQHGQWVSICCPIHKAGAEKHPSMSVNVSDGHFR